MEARRRWLRAACCACFESAAEDAELRLLVEGRQSPQRSASAMALKELSLRSCSAFLRAPSEATPFFGGASFTPALLAFESPMAIACLGEHAPCARECA